MSGAADDGGRAPVLVTRKSPLARRQAETVAAALRRRWRVDVRVLPLSTRGDEITGALADAGGKELFLDNLRRALLAGEADFAVHSLKDMPAAPSPQFTLAAVGFGEDARDVAVTASGAPLAQLPADAAVGTSAPRRVALLRRHFPHLRAVPMRGGIHTRLRKLQNGECAALLLAAAGLRRMGLARHISEVLPAARFVPAVGQGLLAVECLTARPRLAARLAAAGDAAMMRRARAERAFAAAMDGDCHTPLGAHAADAGGGEVELRAFYADGGDYFDAVIRAADAEAAGRLAAADIQAQMRRRRAG